MTEPNPLDLAELDALWEKAMSSYTGDGYPGSPDHTFWLNGVTRARIDIVNAYPALRAELVAAREGWRPIEEIEPGFGEMLGWSPGCGYEVIRRHSDGHTYAGAFSADWVKFARPLPSPPSAKEVG